MLSDFEKGVVYAAGLIVRLHDQPGIAAEIMREAGMDRRNFSDCDDFEKESLRKLQGERGLHLYGL
jgi:hypothetical protein